MDWLAKPHHDGSPMYVGAGPYSLGDTVEVRLRVPDERAADAVLVRSTADAEPALVDARVERSDGTDTWWVAEVELVDPVTNYRFAVVRGDSTSWVNAAGEWPHDVPDAADHRITTHPPAPRWLADAIGYEVFADRFDRSRELSHAPDWAIPADWHDPVERHPDRAVRQLYGGDLAGLERRLDHVVDLGVNLIYLTPFFPARSSHRYDATTFGHVDPLLGGDAALAALTSAAHRRGLRVIGDLTLNHTGNHHDWFTCARADARSAEAGFYMFRDHPDDYVAWYDVPSLPKLDHRDPELRRRLIDGPGSVVAKWLRPPYSLDGWRIDCANTTARHGPTDLNALVAATTRSTMAAERADAWLVAEHMYDATADLRGAGWHGVMAYQWFTRPLVQWLGTADPLYLGSSRPLTRFDGTVAARAMRTLMGGAPWSTITASMTLLDSHDTARLRTQVGGDRTAHVVAMGVLMAFPGVPTIFAGSEIGLGGDSSDTGRQPFPWDAPDLWDTAMLDATRELIAVRRASHALRHGGVRWVDSSPDSMTFLRESNDERVVVHAARSGAAAGRRLALRRLAGAATRPLYGDDGPAIDGDALVLPARAGIWISRLDG